MRLLRARRRPDRDPASYVALPPLPVRLVDICVDAPRAGDLVAITPSAA